MYFYFIHNNNSFFLEAELISKYPPIRHSSILLLATIEEKLFYRMLFEICGIFLKSRLPTKMIILYSVLGPTVCC